MTTVEPQLDHLVYAVPDLAAAVATGVEPVAGGRHLGRGTRNFLVGFGGAAYLEIIGPDVEHPADAGADLGPIGPLSRRTPDGDLLEWRLAATLTARLDTPRGPFVLT